MRNIRSALFILTLAAGTLFATSAAAQSTGLSGVGQGGGGDNFDANAPYTAKEYSRSELINLGTFDTPPIQFKWDVMEVRQKPVGARMDFVITIDASLDSVISFFEGQSKKNESVATLQPNILPFESNRDLIVIGRSRNATPARFTLGANGGTHRFTIDVSADGAQTKVVLQNIMISQLFSGVVPSRAPMTPIDAKPVNFLWN